MLFIRRQLSSLDYRPTLLCSLYASLSGNLPILMRWCRKRYLKCVFIYFIMAIVIACNCVYVLQDVKFQMKLDMYDFCTPELQEKFLPIRKKYKEVEDKKIVSDCLFSNLHTHTHTHTPGNKGQGNS